MRCQAQLRTPRKIVEARSVCAYRLFGAAGIGVVACTCCSFAFKTLLPLKERRSRTSDLRMTSVHFEHVGSMVEHFNQRQRQGDQDRSTWRQAWLSTLHKLRCSSISRLMAPHPLYPRFKILIIIGSSYQIRDIIILKIWGANPRWHLGRLTRLQAARDLQGDPDIHYLKFRLFRSQSGSPTTNARGWSRR